MRKAGAGREASAASTCVCTWEIAKREPHAGAGITRFEEEGGRSEKDETTLTAGSQG